MMHSALISSPLGKIRLTGSESGISRLSFWEKDTVGELTEIPTCLKECARQLEEYFAGHRKEFNLKLDLGDAPAFHQEVWQMVRLIPYGRTRTYGEIAEIIEHPNAFRAVGHANGLNPLPIVIPCHRVIGKDGRLTGYAYGLDMKRWLLAHESPGKYMVQGELFGVKMIST